MSAVSSSLPFNSVNTAKPKKNSMLLSGRVVSVDEHPGQYEGKDFYVYNIQLPSPDGFRGGSRQRFLAAKKGAYRAGDDFEESVTVASYYRKYADNNGEVKRSSYPDTCFVLDE